MGPAAPFLPFALVPLCRIAGEPATGLGRAIREEVSRERMHTSTLGFRMVACGNEDPETTGGRVRRGTALHRGRTPERHLHRHHLGHLRGRRSVHPGTERLAGRRSGMAVGSRGASPGGWRNAPYSAPPLRHICHERGWNPAALKDTRPDRPPVIMWSRMARFSTVLLSFVILPTITAAVLPVIPGDSDRGAKLFEDEQCIKCHAVNGRGGKIGLDLAKTAPHNFSPAHLASAMWNHAPTMWGAIQSAGIQQPK